MTTENARKVVNLCENIEHTEKELKTILKYYKP